MTGTGDVCIIAEMVILYNFIQYIEAFYFYVFPCEKDYRQDGLL